MVKNQKPLSVCQLRYGLKKTVLLRKEDLSSKGRVIEQIYSLARIFFIFSHNYEKCMYSSSTSHSIRLPLLHPYCMLY